MAEDPCERRPHHTTQQQLCFAIICALRRQMKAAFTTRLQRSAPKPERSSAARIIPCKQLASRPATTAAALSPSQDNLLTRLFSSVLKRPDPAQVQLHRDRDELLTLLLSGAASSQAVNAYVDKLAGSKLPFQERNLGGGPWVVRMAFVTCMSTLQAGKLLLRYANCFREPCCPRVQVLHTSGTVQLWKATYEVGRIAKRSNTASQEFDPQQRSALNRAEYYGGSVWVTASGTYEPVVGGTAPMFQLGGPVHVNDVAAFGLGLGLGFSRL